MPHVHRKAEDTGPLNLAALGLDRAASAVYDQILRSPEADAAHLAKFTHTPRVAVEAALSQLIRAGLARTADRPSGVEALRPEAALAQQISLKQRDAVGHVSQLTALREEIADLERLWRRHHRGEVESREFEIVRGVAASNLRIDALLQQSRCVRSADQHRGPYRGTDDAQEQAFRQWLVSGGEARWIEEIAIAEEPGWREYIEELSTKGVSARVAPAVPLQFRIYDDATAVTPLDPRFNAAGIVVCRSEGLVAGLLYLFEELWRQSTDWHLVGGPAGQRVVEGVDRRLPHLLATGSCDDSIARVLGLSSRTVRRQVATLMQRCNAQSRLQLGIALERNGLLRPPVASES